MYKTLTILHLFNSYLLSKLNNLGQNVSDIIEYKVKMTQCQYNSDLVVVSCLDSLA